MENTHLHKKGVGDNDSRGNTKFEVLGRSSSNLRGLMYIPQIKSVQSSLSSPSATVQHLWQLQSCSTRTLS